VRTDSVSAIRPCCACGAPGVVASGALNGWAIARCPSCGVRFTVAVPPDEELRAAYNRLYSEGDAYQMHLDEVSRLRRAGRKTGAGFYRSRIFLNRYHPRPGERLLEVGCGVGTFLVVAQQRGWRVEGTDLSETATEVAQQVHRLPVRVGRFEELDFDEHTYRAIVAWEVLEHLIDPRGFLEKVRRLLMPGGVFACSVPNETSRVPHPEVRGPASLPPVHLNFWARDSLRRLFEVNRFAIAKIITQRSMRSLVNPRQHPFQFMRYQAGALVGLYEGLHLFAAATPVECPQSAARINLAH
jgi:SAM-dependent methyltransferase